jgi:hypothetical protein
MRDMLRPRTLFVIAACAMLVLPAGARADAALNLDGFKLVYPKASALCAKADKGRLGKKLSPSKGKVIAACRRLRKSYSDAFTAYQATSAPLREQSRAIVLEQRKACLAARRARNPAACKQATLQARSQLQGIRVQIAAAAKVAREKYDAARKTFWATIGKLKGAAGLKPDAPYGQDPVSDVPADTELDNG